MKRSSVVVIASAAAHSRKSGRPRLVPNRTREYVAALVRRVMRDRAREILNGKVA